MKARQRIIVALTLLSSAIGFGAVVAIDEPVGAQEAEFEMKIATVAPEGTPWEKQLRALRRYIETESGGRIRVRMFMGGSLGGEQALVRRTAAGTIQCFGGSTAALGSLVPELNVIEAPYIFETEAQADAVLDGGAKPIVARALDAHGVHFGLWAENGFRSWFTKERPIRTPADLHGLRMRSQDALVHLETYRAFGANPVPIDVTNVLTSLQTGVVDGFDNTPLFAFATSWYQAAHHLVLSRHSYQPGIVVYSKRWYDSLPHDLQHVLDSVPQQLVTDGREGVRQMEPILLRNLRSRGIEVHEMSAEERAAFVEVAAPVPDRIARKAGRNGRALLAALRAR